MDKEKLKVTSIFEQGLGYSPDKIAEAKRFAEFLLDSGEGKLEEFAVLPTSETLQGRYFENYGLLVTAKGVIYVEKIDEETGAYKLVGAVPCQIDSLRVIGELTGQKRTILH